MTTSATQIHCYYGNNSVRFTTKAVKYALIYNYSTPSDQPILQDIVH